MLNCVVGPGVYFSISAFNCSNQLLILLKYV